ncbi:hypothetical protein [Sabulicella rubraurantiaca]|nr:hypothetical protein [Sabulicella rubraurantiaca]
MLDEQTDEADPTVYSRADVDRAFLWGFVVALAPCIVVLMTLLTRA